MVNYPNKKKQPVNQNWPVHEEKKLYTAYRGMNLEEDLNESNRAYLEQDIAVIYKKPTPIQIVKVDYPRRAAAKIVEAYYQKPSTTDYNGLYRGHYIDFEAKETKVDYFPFKNISEHQILHLERVLKLAEAVQILPVPPLIHELPPVVLAVHVDKEAPQLAQLRRRDRRAADAAAALAVRLNATLEDQLLLAVDLVVREPVLHTDALEHRAHHRPGAHQLRPGAVPCQRSAHRPAPAAFTCKSHCRAAVKV